MKTVKHTVIIRENDLNDVTYKSIRKGLYDRIDYEPLTYREIQHDNMVRRLKGQSAPRHYELPSLYLEMLFRENNLYNRQYLSWHFTMHFPDGQIWVQSRSDQPCQRLLLATFEKDY